MSERRMFAKTIIDSDAFLDMPLSTQSLYFHLSMRADDDGFINNPRKIQRMIGASDDDMRVLIAKRFIIPFESGIVVIKHWRIHNYIREDRRKETVYQDEMSMLTVKENGAYSISDNVLPDICKSSDGQVTVKCQHRLGEDRIIKEKIGKDNNMIIVDDPDHVKIDLSLKTSDIENEFEQIWREYPKKQGKQNAAKAYAKARTRGVTFSEVLDGVCRYVNYIKVERIEPRYIKHGSTWFNQNCWKDDYTPTRKPTTKDLAQKYDFSDF